MCNDLFTKDDSTINFLLSRETSGKSLFEFALAFFGRGPGKISHCAASDSLLCYDEEMVILRPFNDIFMGDRPFLV